MKPSKHSAPVRKPAVDHKALFDTAADMIWVRNLADGTLLAANAATARLLGYPRKELEGRKFYDFYHPDDRKRVLLWTEHVRKHGSGYLNVVLRARSGRLIEAELRGSMVDGLGGWTLLTIARGIGAENKERRRAAIFYEAFKRSNDVMFYCDASARILEVNDAFLSHYGYRREEVLGRSPGILRSRHSTDELYKRMWSSILDPEKGYWRGEIINKAKDGREVPLILTITAVRDEADEIIGYVSNAVDRTEQVALQARVAQSEALATLGEMAAIVAHEIRNPLGSIVMAAKQFASGELAGEDEEMVLQVLRGESQRLNEALTNFLSYARPRELKFEHKSLNSVIEGVCNIIQSNDELLKDVKLSLSLSKGLKPFPMDPDQIRQVIWNIVLNALQAMEGRGELNVATGRKGGLAFFKIADTGPGIPEETLGAIFKPFHTTKQQGTGLGLAVADRIVKVHGGRIEVDSRIGQGAAFTVYLPSVED